MRIWKDERTSRGIKVENAAEDIGGQEVIDGAKIESEVESIVDEEQERQRLMAIFPVDQLVSMNRLEVGCLQLKRNRLNDR